MRIFKSILNLMSTIFLCGLAITKDVKFAAALLASSGTSLGIILYEFMKNRRK